MPENAMILKMLQAREQHDSRERQAQLAEVRTRPKPGPDKMLSIAEAELLVQAHDYADGEVIGRKPVSHPSGPAACQILRQVNGEVVIDPQHVVMEPHADPAAANLAWSVQSGRAIRKDEVA